ncbi:3D domain-containing protein [Marinicrinis sediminis]|uniref:3D domain-containing protein n=1 Tax=Marinicrinis sediminis TaxID=1652465 RepID=A0ABW5R9V7_9BACL
MSFQSNETEPVKRSSAMSFAYPFTRGNKKWYMIIGAALLASVIGWLLWSQLTAAKTVYLSVDDQPLEISTKAETVAELLEEEELVIGEFDELNVPLEKEIADEDHIQIKYAVPIQLTIAGEQETRYTTAATVGEALADLGVAVDGEDKIFPSKLEAITPDQKVTVIDIEKKVEELEESIPFAQVKEEDHALTKGKQRLVQEGKSGKKVSQIEKIFADGEQVSESILATSVVEEAIDEIIQIGMKNPVTVLSATSPAIAEATMNSTTFSYKQVLNNVTLTAYDAGVGSTGKDKSHPQYGVTYTGTTVAEGRTIAVDPKVIPLGWWVYIDGIGLRKAEDTGSAVKGKHIDVYMESVDEAKQFGRQKGYTVYVIGPKKPS